jgi:hypothetical protein
MVWLDDYERRARLVPGLLLVAPVAVTIVMFGLRTNPVVAAIVGSLAAFGAPVVLANFVRHRGLGVQEGLYESWGGKPTTQLLRAGAAARRKRWRDAVEAVAGYQLPDEEHPDDDAYDAAVAVVISQTRDTKRFKLLYNENRNYGYERNLYGLRVLGRAVAATCLAVSLVAIAVLIGLLDREVRDEWLVGVVVLLALLLLWILLPSRERTRTTAFKYAEQLLDAAVELGRSQR